MKELSLLYCTLVLTFIDTALTIITQCSKSQKSRVCPQHSFCNKIGYCECQVGFLFNCKTKASTINSTYQNFQVKSNTEKLFVIYPSNDTNIFSYRFSFCQQKVLEGVSYKLGLYYDDGTKQVLDKKNPIGKTELIEKKKCWAIMSPFLKFQKQKNNAIESLILSMNISDTSVYNSISQKINGEPLSHKFSLSVIQVPIFDIQMLCIFLFIMIGVAFASLLGGISYCIWWIRIGKKTLIKDNNLDHFEKLMPKIKITQQLLEEELCDEPICPICLFSFQIKSQIRKTICNHYFHVNCLDQWCKKHLSCPVCRQNLEKQTILQFFMGNQKNEEQINREIELQSSFQATQSEKKKYLRTGLLSLNQ